MLNTNGDIAPMNISREANYFDNDLVQYPKQKCSAFPRPQCVQFVACF